MTRAIARRRCFGNLRTSRRKDSERSICKVSLEIAGVSFDLTRLSFASDLSVRALYETIQFFFGNAVFAQCVVISVNRDWTKGDDLVAMENANFLTLRGALKKGREINAG